MQSTFNRKGSPLHRKKLGSICQRYIGTIFFACNEHYLWNNSLGLLKKIIIEKTFSNTSCYISSYPSFYGETHSGQTGNNNQEKLKTFY